MSATEAVQAGATRNRLLAGVSVRHALVAILAVALIARLLVIVATPGFKPFTDSADYDRIAVHLAQHGTFPDSIAAPAGGPEAFRPPLFPIALGAVYKIVGVSSAQTRWTAGRVFEAVLGVVVVALIFLIARAIWTPAVALVSAAMAAIYPPLVLIGSSLMTESLYVPLVLGAVLAALRARESSRAWRWTVASGVLIGLAMLTRSNGVALLPAIALLVWTARPRRSWRSVRGPLAVIGVAALMLVPWTIRNANAFGEFVPFSTEGGSALAGTFSPEAAARTDFPAMWVVPVPEIARLPHGGRDLNEAQLSDRLTSDATHYIEAHPGYVLKAVFWNSLRLLNLSGAAPELWIDQYGPYPPWLAHLSVFAFWPLGLLAIAGAFTRLARRAPRALWACPALVFLSSVFFIGAIRYRAPADPFLIMLAALGLFSGVARVRASRQESAAGIA